MTFVSCTREEEEIKSSHKCPLNAANYFIFSISFDSIHRVSLSRISFQSVVRTARAGVRLNERGIYIIYNWVSIEHLPQLELLQI